MSYAQSVQGKTAKAQETIQEAASISPEQYSQMMFEHGVKFAEHFCRNFLNREGMIMILLEKKEIGYWMWFELAYRNDDLLLVHKDCWNLRTADAWKYNTMKEFMIGDERLENDLYHFISDTL